MDRPHPETPLPDRRATDRSALDDLAAVVLGRLPWGVILQEPDLSIVEANTAAARILGLTTDQLLGRDSLDPRWQVVRRDLSPWPGEDHPAPRALRTGEPVHDEVMGVLTPEGAVRWIRVDVELLHHPGPEDLRALCSYVDVTEQVLAEEAARTLNEELARSNTDLERFAAAVAHDLRTPLTGVRGYAELLLRRAGDRLGDALPWAQALDASARRLQEMLDGLLVAARADQVRIGREPVDLGELVRAVVADLAPEVSRHGAHVVVLDPVERVFGDDVLLRQLVMNLLTNACRFGRPGVPATVTIGAVTDVGDPSRVVLAVVDGGRGVPDGDKETVLGLFRRGPGAEETSGAGVGLALCQRVAERHGGRLRLQDTAGGGLTVLVDLPAAR